MIPLTKILDSSIDYFHIYLRNHKRNKICRELHIAFFGAPPLDRRAIPTPLRKKTIKAIGSEVLLYPPVAEKVFSHLGIQDQFRCRAVCKAWNSLTQSRHFRTVVRMDETNETWNATSHRIVLHMLRSIPEFRNMNRSAYYPILRRSSITVLREGALVGIAYLTNGIFQGLINDNVAAIRAMSYDDLIRYNLTLNVPYTNPSDTLISMMLDQYIYRFFSYSVFGGLGLWRLYNAASEIRTIWGEEFIAANERARNTLDFPLNLSTDPILSKYVCFHSQKVMRFPIQDQCPIDVNDPNAGHHHLFDYLSIRNLQGPIICPYTRRIIALESITLRLDIFRAVQQRLRELYENQSELLSIEEYNRLMTSSPIP